MSANILAGGLCFPAALAIQGSHVTVKCEPKFSASILDLKERDVSSHLALILGESANDNTLRMVSWFGFPRRRP